MDNAGVDNYGFSVLPAGARVCLGTNCDGSYFYGRGYYAMFLTSTYYSANTTAPILRTFANNMTEVRRMYQSAAATGMFSAYSVRCIR
jgi:uncharacterized protein (TIGR02145 family)